MHPQNYFRWMADLDGFYSGGFSDAAEEFDDQPDCDECQEHK